MIELNNNKYEIIKNYKDAFNQEEFTNLYTEYFEEYDYVVGDIAYNKLRLKGFYDENNKKVSSINNIANLNEYLKNNCPNDCRYFVAKKIKE